MAGQGVPAAAIRYRAEVINPDLTHAARSPRSGTLVAVGSDSAVWRMPASARQFEPTEAGQGAANTAALNRVAFDAEGGVAVAVGEGGVLLRSDDDGLSWGRIALPVNGSLRDVIALPRSGEWLVAAGDGVVLRSSDGARSWQAVTVGASLQLGRLFAAADGRVWVVGEASAIAVSADQGRSWQLRHMQAGAEPLRCLAEAQGVMLAGSGNGRLLRSADGGKRWERLQTPSTGFTEVIQYVSGHKTWVALTHQGDSLWSRDQGRHWQRSGEPLGTGLSSLLLDAAQQRLVAVGHAGVVQTSVDGGRRWSRQRLGGDVDLLGLAPIAAGTPQAGLLAWGRFGAVYRADAAGRRWQPLRAPLAGDVVGLVHVPADGGVVAVGNAGWVARSADGGRSWNPVPMKFVVDMYPTDFRALRVLPDGRSLLAAGPTGSIMRSDDGGLQWRSVMHRAFETAEVPVDLVATRGGAWVVPEMSGPVDRSVDQGRQWQRQPALPGHAAGSLLRTGLASAFDGVLLLAGKSGRLLRSEDDGASWSAVDLPAPQNLFALWADAGSPRWWLAGADGALLYSEDSGRRWQLQAIESDAPVRSVLLLITRIGSGRLMLAGREGVIALSDDGLRWRRVSSGTGQDLRLALQEPTSGHALLAGRGGLLLQAMDPGGERWQPVYSHTAADFRAALALPDGSLLAAGRRIVRLVPQAWPH